MNLYLIRLTGRLGVHYVIAPDPTTAYQRIRFEYDKNDYGFRHERALFSIELLAEDAEYPECKIRLWLPESLAQIDALDKPAAAEEAAGEL